MGEYRPWAPAAEDGMADTDDPEEPAEPVEAPYAPWAGQAPGQAPAPIVPVTPAKEARFETPPGLGDPPKRRTGDHAHETAAAMLLWTGGFVLLSSIALVAMMTLAIDIERIAHGGYDPDIAAMQDVRFYGGLGIFAALLFIAPGIGLLYQQPWARPIGFVGATVTLLLGPVGLVLGIIALVNLGRMEVA